MVESGIRQTYTRGTRRGAAGTPLRPLALGAKMPPRARLAQKSVDRLPKKTKETGLSLFSRSLFVAFETGLFEAARTVSPPRETAPGSPAAAPPSKRQRGGAIEGDAHATATV